MIIFFSVTANYVLIIVNGKDLDCLGILDIRLTVTVTLKNAGERKEQVCLLIKRLDLLANYN